MTNATAISRSRVWSVLTTPAGHPPDGATAENQSGHGSAEAHRHRRHADRPHRRRLFPGGGRVPLDRPTGLPHLLLLPDGGPAVHPRRAEVPDLRLGIFALVSQPFYILAFHPVGEFWANLTNWNIFFTLFLSLLGMYGLKERKWWLFALALFTVSWWNFDYSGTGIQLMLIFYLCRNRPRLGAALYLLSYLPALMNGWPEDPLCLTVGGLCIDWSILRRVRRAPDLLRHALPHQGQHAGSSTPSIPPIWRPSPWRGISCEIRKEEFYVNSQRSAQILPGGQDHL